MTTRTITTLTVALRAAQIACVAASLRQARVPNLVGGRGATVRCADGAWSQSGGLQGACSHHGGCS